MLKKLTQIKLDTEKELEFIKNIEDFDSLHNKIFGRKGEYTLILKTLSDLTIEEKKTIGKEANIIKKDLLEEFDKKKKTLLNTSSDIKLDFSEPGKKIEIGHHHPIYKTQREVEDIFTSMGFSVYEGPELDNEYFNFDALNIPKSHPARDMQDTFFMNGENLVMRTHTSNTQNRIYKKFKPPFQVIIPGRCFRNEATDASHDITFHQVEGIVIGENISLAHLKGTMKNFLSELFKKEVKVRFRPGFFPFVEPGLELDFSCLLCDGKGCPVCKKTGWVEFMGCGMIHPKVLEFGEIDTNKYNGFAFGFGLTRLVMMKYGIEDIRHFHSGNLKFTEQF